MTNKMLKFATLTLSIFALFITSCTKETNYGPVVTRTLEIQRFDGIKMSSSEDVVITQGSGFKVVAIGNEDILDKISLEVNSNIWDIHLLSGNYSNYDLRYEITMPTVNYLDVSGSGDMTVKNFIGEDHLSTHISGSGNIYLDSYEGVGVLTATISGSGNIVANGFSDIFDLVNVNISGSGNYNGFAISSDKSTMNISGSGNIETTVKNTLRVKISGSGNVSYKGRPTVDVEITGSGKLINAN